MVVTEDVLANLHRNGYFVAQVPLDGQAAVEFLIDLGRSLGDLYVPPDCDAAEPILRSAPTRARRAAPFDRPEAIGWHGDFATHGDRPELSLVYVTRGDPRGGDFGAWRLASVDRVLSVLRATPVGRTAFDRLSREPLPFSYTDGQSPVWYSVIECRPMAGFGLRFFRPSIYRGCIAAFGEVPSDIAMALASLEDAANEVGEIVPTQAGSLLIASNWFALHDRVRQTVSRTRANREALLCFVARLYDGVHRNPNARKMLPVPDRKR